MAWRVRLTRDAARDLEDLHDYIARHDSPLKADRLLDRLSKIAGSLASAPQRGGHPPELLALGIRDYRQVFFKPYRMVYFIERKTVYILLIADGRRDMEGVLARRLLGK